LKRVVFRRVAGKARWDESGRKAEARQIGVRHGRTKKKLWGGGMVQSKVDAGTKQRQLVGE
jgi:hypothetical protein